MNHIHNPAKETEIEAFLKVQPQLESIRAGILKKLNEVGDYGLIPDEYPGLINTIRRRFTDLWVDGLIRQTEKTRTNKNGNEELIWVLGADPNRSDPKTASIFIFCPRVLAEKWTYHRTRSDAERRLSESSGTIHEAFKK